MPVAAVRGGRIPIEFWCDVDAVLPTVYKSATRYARLPQVFHHGVVLGADSIVVAARGIALPHLSVLQPGLGVTAARMQSAPSVSVVENFLQNLRSIKVHRQMFRSDVALRRDADSLVAEFEEAVPAQFHDLRDAVANRIGYPSAYSVLDVCRDDEDQYWVVFRDGAHHIGDVLGHALVRAAEEDPQNRAMPPDAVLLREGSAAYDTYVRCMNWLQRYAALCRRAVLWLLQRALGDLQYTTVVSSHVNSVGHEQHYDQSTLVMRRGAVRVNTDGPAVVCGRQRHYVVDGAGCALSFCSAAADLPDDALALEQQRELYAVRRVLRSLVRWGPP